MAYLAISLLLTGAAQEIAMLESKTFSGRGCFMLSIKYAFPFYLLYVLYFLNHQYKFKA
ncbi:hypothetical protein [Marinilactibacillus kalidii]|uniref:hypothetical protein n=1 Tax=Marinilactibacillus kalidii TaxID=2820274 RepID=UPI001ABEE41D|nr:hypothetical protein [Marinilactibacillus kalidii]